MHPRAHEKSELCVHPPIIYLAALVVGIGLVLNDAWVLLLVFAPLLVMDRRVIPREERHLEERFGQDYPHYKAAVRRWL